MPTLVTIDLDTLDWTHQEAADLLDGYALETGSTLLADMRDQILAQKPVHEPTFAGAVVKDAEGDVLARQGTSDEEPWVLVIDNCDCSDSHVGETFAWEDLIAPVEILFSGVE